MSFNRKLCNRKLRSMTSVQNSLFFKLNVCRLVIFCNLICVRACVRVTEREGKLIPFCPCTSDHLLHSAVSAIYLFCQFWGLFCLVLHILCSFYFYAIILIIAADTELNVGGNNRWSWCAFHHKNNNPDWLSKYWSMLLVLGGPWTERLDHGVNIHSLFIDAGTFHQPQRCKYKMR